MNYFQNCRKSADKFRLKVQARKIDYSEEMFCHLRWQYHNVNEWEFYHGKYPIIFLLLMVILIFWLNLKTNIKCGKKKTQYHFVNLFNEDTFLGSIV